MTATRNDGLSTQRLSLAAPAVKGVGAARLPDPAWPEAQGLFDPALEKDSCGVGFIANIKGRKSHQIVKDAIQILLNLEHRGATGADPRAGDGAGILVQTPHAFFKRKAGELGIELPEPGQYAVGFVFMPHELEVAKGDSRHLRRHRHEGRTDVARLARRADRQRFARRSR